MMILDPDDLEIGKLVAVYDSDESRELRGASLQITAINLPFIGGLINFLLIILGLGTLALRLSELPRWSAPQAA